MFYLLNKQPLLLFLTIFDFFFKFLVYLGGFCGQTCPKLSKNKLTYLLNLLSKLLSYLLHNLLFTVFLKTNLLLTVPNLLDKLELLTPKVHEKFCHNFEKIPKKIE